MFCVKCGVEIESDAQFCQNCGKSLAIVSDSISHTINSNQIIENNNILYSKDWHQKEVFVISSAPRFDIIVDNQYLYLIKLPKYNNSTIGFLLGLLIGNIIGAYIGSSMGESSDEKKRQWYRSAWINTDNKLFSREYERDIFKKIPLSKLRGNIVFKKNKFIIMFEGKKIALGREVRSFRKTDQTEFNRLNKYIEKYVL